MTPDIFWGFLAGSLAASMFWMVFGAVKYNEVWRENQLLLLTARQDRATIEHLKGAADPRAWLDSDDVAVNIAGRELLYDKYPDLVVPGTETIIIDSELEEDGDEQAHGT